MAAESVPATTAAEVAPSPPPFAGAKAKPCWSSIIQNKNPNPSPSHEEVASRVILGSKPGMLNNSSSSSKGVSVAVVDANAIIHIDKLAAGADRFVTVREVLDEVRDPNSRRYLSFLPLPIETIEPSPDSIKKVVKFARETGDLQTLSDVDIKLIALTYMLESQIHGANHLRVSPPPLRVINVRTLKEADLPGWGSNVPNLAEWEALEQSTDGGMDQDSRILPLKDLDNNVVSTNVSDPNPQDQEEGGYEVWRKPRRSFPPKKEITIEGKKMVASGIDASLGEDNDSNDDWRPAVSRSTHRRYLRRKARRELNKPAEEAIQLSVATSVLAEVREADDVLSDGKSESGDTLASKLSHVTLNEDDILQPHDINKHVLGEDDSSIVVNQIRTSQNQVGHADEQGDHVILTADAGFKHDMGEEISLEDVGTASENDEVDMSTGDLDNLEFSNPPDGITESSVAEDCSSEQSWMLRSLSDSTVACVTSDYAMQNVILQIGLRLLAPAGMQIRQLHRWVLKCHACNKVTQEIGRIFCPKCGNGGTLRKVSVTVGENGITLASRRQRIILRGTKFSLPLPQGGRDAITKNPILREDQLPRKFLYPNAKKKNKQDDEFFSSDSIFSNTSEKRAPLKPPVRKAMAMFRGRRNPNDNHFSRRRC